METEIFSVYTKAKGREKRQKPTKEIQQRLNQRHADGNRRNLLHTNFTDADQVVTLTSNDDHLHEPIEDSQRQLSAELQFPVSYARILLE